MSYIRAANITTYTYTFTKNLSQIQNQNFTTHLIQLQGLNTKILSDLTNNPIRLNLINNTILLEKNNIQFDPKFLIRPKI